MLPFVPLHKLMRRTADDGWQEKHLYAASSSFTAADSESALPFLEHPQQPPPSFHPFRHLLRIVGYILAAIALVVIVLFIGIHPSRRLSPIPIFPTEILIFHQDAAYAAPASPSSDALWDANLPNGKGFVLLKDASEYRLPPGLPSGGDNETDLYGVTWTHEYHCLKLIRTEFWKALDGTSKLYGGEQAQPPLEKMDLRRLVHVQHCMDYIRQLIMCRADMTVEWAAPYPDAIGNKHHIDGYGVPRTCTKWDDMYDYMIEHKSHWRHKHQDEHEH